MSGPQNPYGQGHRPTSSDYDRAVRGKGYTVPYKTPPGEPLPPRGLFYRFEQYNNLRKRAQASSMAWWGTKVLQGCLLSLIPLLFGLVLTGVYVVMGGGIGKSVLGVLLLVVGLIVLLRYVLAPWTARWIVNVAENGYWVVEDGNGHTAEYLPPGRMIVPFRMNSKVHRYVTFQTLTVREIYDNVLPGTGQNVSLEIKVSMIFNPVEADPRFYGRLRMMTQKEQFENVVRNHVRDAVSQYFTRLSPAFWERALQNPKMLEEAIIDQLIGLESMGLFLGSGQPVTIFVRGITISSGSPPPDPEFSMRDPFDLPPPPSPRRGVEPLPEQDFDSQPTIRSGQGFSGDGEDRRPLNWEPSIDDGATMPHVRSGGSRGEYADLPKQPPFVPGSIDLDIGDDDTDIDTLLKRVKENRERPKDDRRAKPSDRTQPRTTRPDFWIRGRDDRD